jgi:hypothetical protein
LPGLEAAPAGCRRVAEAEADGPDTLGEDAFVLVMVLVLLCTLSYRVVGGTGSSFSPLAL